MKCERLLEALEVLRGVEPYELVQVLSAPRPMSLAAQSTGCGS